VRAIEWITQILQVAAALAAAPLLLG